MRRLFSAQAEILKKVRKARRVLLLLDYDGTLVPIKPSPELARLALQDKKLLASLAAIPKFKVGILTGRSMPDIKRAVSLPGLLYAAHYGLKITRKKRSWTFPQAKGKTPLVKRVTSRLREILRKIREVWTEDKKLTVAVHYRHYRGKPRALKQKIMAVLDQWPNEFLLKEGKKIFEVFPAVRWDKGKALLKVKRMLGSRRRSLVIFIGDDRADEEAFRHMSRTDISVVVGRRKNSAARFYCRDSKEVAQFLKLLGQG